MPIDIAGISLTKVHKIQTLEKADFVSHRISGLNGNVVQDMGRHSVTLMIEGIYYGENAAEDLTALRDIYHAREPVDFLAEIVETAYFSQVVLQQLNVNQKAGFPNQFEYSLIVSEYVPPPEPVSTGLGGLDGFPEVDAAIELEALDFMEMIQLPDLFSVPAFQNPTEPLDQVEGQLRELFEGFDGSATELGGLFSGEPDEGNLPPQGFARGIDDIDESISLFGQVNENVDASNLQTAIGDQEGLLNGADGDLEQILADVLDGLTSVLDWLTNTALPQLSQPGVIQQAFSDLEELIPGDTSALTGGLSSALEDFFGDIDTNFVGDLTGIVQAFEAINNLRNRFFSSTQTIEEEDETQDEGTRGLSIRSVEMRVRGGVGETNALAEELGRLLDILPDPFNAKSLLEWILDGLKAIPRDKFPLGYLPIYDELTDKLETALGWLNMDANEIENHLVNTITQLTEHIQKFILDENTGLIVSEITSLSEKIPDVALISHIDNAISGLEGLKPFVDNGDLTGSEAIIDSAYSAFEELLTALNKINAEVLSGQHTQLSERVRKLEDESEARMIQLIALLSPPSELDIIRRLSEPFNELLEQTGISTIGDRMREMFEVVTDLLDKLNISAIKDTLEGGINEATDAIEGLQNRLTEATMDFSLLMDEVKGFIANLGIDDLREEMRNGLNEFQTLVEDGTNTVFEPVRGVLNTGMDTLTDIFEFIDLQAIIDELINLLDTLEDILLAPELKTQIDTIREAINTVNRALEEFSITSVANTVIDVINLVKGAFELVSSLPLTGSLLEDIVKEIERNEILSPEGLRSKVNFLLGVLGDVIEQGPKAILIEIKDKPALLVEYLSNFSPDQFLNDNLFDAYRNLIAKLEDFKPSLLVEPVDEALNGLKDQALDTLDPEKLLLPLEGPFDEVKNLLTQIDPQEIINPLNEVLQDGIRTVTDNLPLDVADDIFEKVNEFANTLEEALDTMCAFRDKLNDLNDRLSGIDDADTQIVNLGDDVVARLDTLSDFSTLQSTFSQLESVLDQTKADTLKQQVSSPLTGLLDKLTNLDAKNRLILLINAHRAISIPAVEALPDDMPEKALLLNLLNTFDPLAVAFSEPMDALSDWKDELENRKNELDEAFSEWDARFHHENGPLSQLRASSLSLAEFKAFLRNTVRQQFAEELAPTFKILDHFQSILAVILSEFSDLIAEIEEIVNDFLAITDALEELREALDNFINMLNNLDLSFLATEVQEIFDEVGNQLELLRPSSIAADLKQSFEELLAIFDIDTLLGIPTLDAKYQHLLDLLVNPIDDITGQLQPRFDSLLEFILCFDFSTEIDAFLARVEGIEGGLSTDLNRIIDAYEDMFDVIPSDIQAEANFSVG